MRAKLIREIASSLADREGRDCRALHYLESSGAERNARRMMRLAICLADLIMQFASEEIRDVRALALEKNISSARVFVFLLPSSASLP